MSNNDQRTMCQVEFEKYMAERRYSLPKWADLSAREKDAWEVDAYEVNRLKGEVAN